MTKKRVYDNSLREKRAAQTRDRITKALSELIAKHTMDDLSVPKLAELAGVSEPTVYRYFPNRQALLDALDEAILKEFPRPPMPETLGELPDFIEKLFILFDEDRELILSFFKTVDSRETRKGLRRKRLELLRKQVDTEFPALCDQERKEIFGVMQLLASGEGWRAMAEFADMDGAQSGKATAWALRALIADARAKNAKAENENGGAKS
jgi:AcrR family transcriptional regulator